MKEDECRKLDEYEFFYYYNFKSIKKRILIAYDIAYVDSNQFLHNLDDYAFHEYNGQIHIGYYFIHGKQYKKQDWELELNSILMLSEL